MAHDHRFTMNTRTNHIAALAIALVFSIAGTAHAADAPTPGARLVGTWRGNSLAIVPDDLREKMAALPEDQQPFMTVTYGRDGAFSSTLDAMGKSSIGSGTWKVVSENGDKLEVTTTGPDKKTSRTMQIAFLDPDTIEVESATQSGKLKLARFRSVLDEPAPDAAKPKSPSAPPKPRTDRSKEFTYVLPEGWQVLHLDSSPHDILVLPSSDGAKRNIKITDEAWMVPLEKVKEKYDQDLPKMLKDFKPIESAVVELPGKRQALKMIYINSNPGVPVRQITYITTIGDKRHQISATAMEADGDKLDKLVENFVAGIAPVAAEKK
jgi:hypothetical protein